MTPQETWTLYATYAEAWKPISDDQRAALVAASLAADLDYRTPQVQGGAQAAIADMQGFQQRFPGAHFAVEDMSAHHDVALFTWVLVQANGTALLKGHDQIRIDASGKIAAIITFAPSTPKP